MAEEELTIEAAMAKLEALNAKHIAATRELEELLRREPPDLPGRKARRARARWLAKVEEKKAKVEALYAQIKVTARRVNRLIAAIERGIGWRDSLWPRKYTE
ncbi:MAG: hypothetical protein H5U00_10465 [Clostridia bacterium]|nr:hypothetical protein [Clostridia bacterium]